MPKLSVEIDDPVTVTPVYVMVEVEVLVTQLPYGQPLGAPVGDATHTSFVAFALVGSGKYKTWIALPWMVQGPPHDAVVVQPGGISYFHPGTTPTALHWELGTVQVGAGGSVTVAL